MTGVVHFAGCRLVAIFRKVVLGDAIAPGAAADRRRVKAIFLVGLLVADGVLVLVGRVGRFVADRFVTVGVGVRVGLVGRRVGVPEGLCVRVGRRVTVCAPYVGTGMGVTSRGSTMGCVELSQKGFFLANGLSPSLPGAIA
mmetsp:Transcript_10615/g.17377  ORF Transcript_10615/g.17377 Transcript_10615/m.17377 type:complete len:141 (+) Transcript_10615:974-1396(+)